MAHSGLRRSIWLDVWQRLGFTFARPRKPLAAPSGLTHLLAGDIAAPHGDIAVPSGLGPASTASRPPDSDALPQDLVAAQNGRAYRAPTDLQRTELPIRRVLVIGSCLSGEWIKANRESGAIFDYIVTNNFSPLPDMPPAALTDYDFQLIQIPLRSIMHENTYGHLPPTNEAYQTLFGAVTNWLSQYLDIALAWNTQYGLLSFVTNFMVPQQNPLGRLLPRNDLRNMVYFIEKLNEHLVQDLVKRSNVHLLDIDQIAATYGRRTVQDDAVWVLSHGAALNDADYALDRQRIVPAPAMSAHYPPIDGAGRFFLQAAWTELTGMYRTIRGLDQVKLVIFDLDDTLWRGVAAEQGDITPDMFEGWPIGLMEAACFLKSRGILLAICSRNDEARITALFDRIGGGRLALADFATKRINWRPKHENIQDILDELHLTAHSAVFVDDNPVERAAIQATLPHIRTLGAHPYYLRRILLWAPETQRPVITDESARRTDMIQAQTIRDQSGAGISREDFLATLGLRMHIIDINATDHRQFPRALELINKTNQFNSTGLRRTLQECAALFASGTVFRCFELQDRFSHYGLVGIAVLRGARISQFVMSCRVLGLGAETALLAHLAKTAGGPITADYTATELNGLAGDFLHRHSFVKTGPIWQVETAALPAAPSHIEVA